MRARLVSLSSCSKMTVCLSRESAGCTSLSDTSSQRSDSALTRSTTRPSLEEVDKIMLPHADISTAGVIMAVKTAIAELESIEKVSIAGSFIETNQAKGNWPTIRVLSCVFNVRKLANPQIGKSVSRSSRQEQKRRDVCSCVLALSLFSLLPLPAAPAYWFSNLSIHPT